MFLTRLVNPRLFLLNKNNINASVCSCFNQINHYSSKPPQTGIVKEIDPITGEAKKKKTNIIPKITLLSGEQLSVTTLTEAEKLAKRRDLKLVKIVDLDAKTQRPVYKLMTGAEYHAEDLKSREQKKKDKNNSFIKGEKMLLLNSKITEHDLQTQIKKCLKWIEKLYEVRVVINGDSDKAEKIFSSFETNFKDSGCEARFVQKRQKGSDLKFQILPVKKKSETL